MVRLVGGLAIWLYFPGKCLQLVPSCSGVGAEGLDDLEREYMVMVVT